MIKTKKIYLCLASALLMLGCKSMHPQPQNQGDPNCPNGVCEIKDIKPQRSMQSPEYVSYTEVAADYKSYGERTPLDHKIGTSGAASNLSSSIPPVLEEEVSLYEENVNGLADIQEEEITEEVVDNASLEDPIEDWLAEEGMTLKDLLTKWSEKSGWRLVWKTNRNYTLTAGAMFRARFADASSALIRAFARARPAPIATFYKGNRVLVIETMEDENAYE